MRKRVWLSPVPGVGFRGVATKRLFGWSVLYRDHWGKCCRSYEIWPSADLVVDRGKDGP